MSGTVPDKPETRSCWSLSVFSPLSRHEIEHPRRLEAMKAVLTSSSTSDKYTELFFCTDDLAYSEIKYYYKKRKIWAIASSLVRFLAWVFGLAGVLMPFLSTIMTGASIAVANTGYMLIAAAAAFAGANSLFGLTSGHMRFLVAQLRLERLMTTRRLAWQALCETCGQGDATAQAASATQKLALISEYANLLYDEMAQETDGWTRDLTEAVKKLSSDIATLKTKGGAPT